MNRLPRSRGVPRWLALVLVASLLAPSLLAAQAALEATFADLKGEVEWSPAGSTQYQAAALNTVLHAGDRIRTSANSAARLAFYEGSATQLGDTTEVRLDALQQGTDQNLVRLAQTAGITQGEVQQTGATATNYEVETSVSVTSAPPTTCPWVRMDADGSTLVRNYVSGAARPAAAPITVPQIQFQQTTVPGPFGPVPLLQAVPTQGEVTPSVQTIADQQALNPCPFDGGAAQVPYSEVFAAADDPALFAAADADAARLLLATDSTLVAARALVGEPPPIAGEPPSADTPAPTAGGGASALDVATDIAIPTFDGSPARPTGQLADQATLETVQPTVQWASGSGAYQPVPARQTVSVGDRVRTGTGAAAARLTYFEGSATELSADTELTVQRLERSPGGNIVGSIFQAVGTTVSRVVQLTDPAASFEIDTPAATAIVRGTSPQVTVAPDGVTRVRNVPDGTGGLVRVRGKDPARTEVTLQPGQQTVVLLNQVPQPASGFSALLSLGGRSLAVRNTTGGQQRTVQVGPGQETRIRPGGTPSEPTTMGQVEGLSGALLANLAQQEQARAQRRAGEQEQAAAQALQNYLQLQQIANQFNQTNRLPPAQVPLSPIRITLTWGQLPTDLDAHLWVPLSAGSQISTQSSSPSQGTPTTSHGFDVLPGFGQPTGPSPTLVPKHRVGYAPGGASKVADSSLRLLSAESFDGPSLHFGFSRMLNQASSTAPGSVVNTSNPPSSGVTSTTPCTNVLGGTCAITGSGTSGTYVKTGSGIVNVNNIVLPVGPPQPAVGTIPVAFVPTSLNPNPGEQINCSAISATFTTNCNGSTAGDPIGGAQMNVLFTRTDGSRGSTVLTIQPGTIVQATATPTVTPTPTLVLQPGAPGFTEVFFGFRGSLTSPPFALLQNDVTTGFGPEVIVIQQVLPGRYLYAVQNFSQEVPFPQSQARVLVERPFGPPLTFTVPQQGSGQWWTVFELDGTTGEILPINQISNQPPLPSRSPNQVPRVATATPTRTGG